MASSSMSTLLVIGATSGIGEAFTRYYHSQGVTVIAGGRRQERLDTLAAELPGLHKLQIDVEDIASLEGNLTSVIVAYPKIDAVFIVSGIMRTVDFKDTSSSSVKEISTEITTNLIAPSIIARVFVPHFLALDRPTTFLTVSSALAFVPLPFYPVYNSTKSGLHALCLTLRAQLAGTKVNVIEVAPPYVDTDLDKTFRDRVIEAQGGKDNSLQPMPLDEYMKATVLQLEEGGHKEIGIGLSDAWIKAWRGAFDPIMGSIGIQA